MATTRAVHGRRSARRVGGGSEQDIKRVMKLLIFANSFVILLLYAVRLISSFSG